MGIGSAFVQGLLTSRSPNDRKLSMAVTCSQPRVSKVEARHPLPCPMRCSSTKPRTGFLWLPLPSGNMQNDFPFTTHLRREHMHSLPPVKAEGSSHRVDPKQQCIWPANQASTHQPWHCEENHVHEFKLWNVKIGWERALLCA